MTGQEMLAAQKRADSIVDKLKTLLALESQLLEAGAAARDAAHEQSGNGSLQDLKARLKTSVEELNRIADELEWAVPRFRAYVLPQIGAIMEGRASFDSQERQDLERVIAALTDAEGAEASEELASEIIARLRANLEKTFGS